MQADLNKQIIVEFNWNRGFHLSLIYLYQNFPGLSKGTDIYA